MLVAKTEKVSLDFAVPEIKDYSPTQRDPWPEIGVLVEMKTSQKKHFREDSHEGRVTKVDKREGLCLSAILLHLRCKVGLGICGKFNQKRGRPTNFFGKTENFVGLHRSIFVALCFLFLPATGVPRRSLWLSR